MKDQNQNPHNQRLRLVMAGYFADWRQIERIWMGARKVAATKAATDALDDFITQHDSQTTDKTKE